MSDRSTSRRALRALQVVVTVAAIAWLASHVSVAELGAAVRTLPIRSAVAALLAWTVAFLTGAVRWRWLLSAYGADRVPSPGWLLRMYFVGLFYNNYVPGGVGGDVVRGAAARIAWDRDAATGAARGIAVSVVERLCGLFGLMVLVSGAMALYPIAEADALRPWALVALVLSLAGVAVLALAQRLAGSLPAPIGPLLDRLPPLVRPVHLAAGLTASVLVHTLVAVAGFAVVQGLAPDARLGDALVFVPLSLATTYLPISIGGAGVREAAFVQLYGTVGVPAETAIAASLSLFAIQLGMGAIGGVVQWLGTPAIDEEAQR